MTPTIVVPCYNRPASLRRLCESLLVADYSGFGEIRLVFSVDRAQFDDVHEYALCFLWPYGEKIIVKHETNIGLRKNIIFCGELTRKYGGVIVLEDDSFVAPGFYLFASKALEFYSNDDRVAGISLYAYEYGELSCERFHPLRCGYESYLMRWPSSRGQAWSRGQWECFRSWYGEDGPVDWDICNIPDTVKQWPATSWKKYFASYLEKADKYFVYPYDSFVTNCGELGSNTEDNLLPTVQVPITLSRNRSFNFAGNCDLVPLYDCYFQPEKRFIDTILPELAKFDYVVDLQSSKRLDQIETEYLLSTRPCSAPVFQFGWSLIPLELNVVFRVDGDEIRFGKTEAFSEHAFGYGELRLILWTKRLMKIRQMIRMAILLALRGVGKRIAKILRG